MDPMQDLKRSKRNWKEYEKELLSRKKKMVEFFIRKPTKEELESELEEMNKNKIGRRYELPNSMQIFGEFFKHCFGSDDRTTALFLSEIMSQIMAK